VKHRAATKKGAILDPVHPLKCIVSRTVHRAPIIQMIKQTIQLLEKGTHRCDDRAAIDTCIADSSMCIEYIINPVRHWVKLIKRLKII
jgi:hypothetical protein